MTSAWIWVVSQQCPRYSSSPSHPDRLWKSSR